jgi:preprotein translocase subunit YajC
LLLADAEPQTAVPTKSAPDQGAGQVDAPHLFAMLAIMGILFYFMMIRPQKKKEKTLRDRVHNVKENERVVTIGGIYGIVTNVQRDAERVTIRVDESTGTKLRVNMSAIARVLTGEEEETAAGGNKS